MTNLPAETANPAPTESSLPLVWMIISQLIELLSLAPWLMVAGLSVMAFDSGETPLAWLLVGTVWGYPLLPLVCSILAWILYASKRRQAAVVVTSLPILIVLLALIIFGIFMLPSLVATGPGQMIISTPVK